MNKHFLFAALLLLTGACGKDDGVISDYATLDAILAPSDRAVTVDGTAAWPEDASLSLLTESGRRITARLKKDADTEVGYFRFSSGLDLRCALYPASSDFKIAEGHPVVTLKASRTTDEEAPFFALPAVSGEQWVFRCLTGVLRIRLSAVPANAASLVLSARGQKLSGEFAIQETVAVPSLTLSATERADSVITVTFPDTGAETVDFPLPAGTLGVWSLELRAADGSSLARSRGEEIVIQRGAVTLLDVSFHADSGSGSTIMDLIPEDGEW